MSVRPQRLVFLESEGDAWYARNEASTSKWSPEADPVVQHVTSLGPQRGSRLLEIGCGSGRRLAWMQNRLGITCSGIDPSEKAISEVRAQGIEAIRGTADSLPWEASTFDIVVFGFCLYVCDTNELFRIAAEADRILKAPGWVIIVDFHSRSPVRKYYQHHEEISTNKMNYPSMFLWHQDYALMDFAVRGHGNGERTDLEDEWVAVALLRKLERQGLMTNE